MEGDGGHWEDEEEGLAAHYYAAEDDVEGLLEDGTDDAADFPHTGAGEDGGRGNGDGDGDSDGDAPLGAALLPGDAREATGRAVAALVSLRLSPLARGHSTKIEQHLCLTLLHSLPPNILALACLCCG